MVADYDRRIEVAVETKHPTRYGRLVEKRVVEMLRDFGWDRAGTPARVMSFSLHRTAARGGARTRGASGAGWSTTRSTGRCCDAPSARTGSSGPASRCCASEPELAAPDPEARPRHPRLDGQHRGGPASSAWSSGVKAVITDRPAYMLDLLDDAGRRTGR